VGSYALLVALSVPYPIAGVVSYGLGILNGYTWNRIWTFETGTFHGPEFARYLLVQGLAALANAGGLAIAVEVLGLGELVAELVVLPPLVLVTYAVNRSWTFRPR
jgi:putative flippase GtrA